MNENDFDAVYRRYIDELFRYVVKQVGRRDVAEEITSESFLALYRSFDRVDPNQLRPWLFAVARNRVIDYWRHQAIENKFASEYRPSVAPAPELSLEHLLRGIRRLKPVHRLCLILRYVDGLDRSEIARETGLSETQVKGHLQYGRQLLKREWAAAK